MPNRLMIVSIFFMIAHLSTYSICAKAGTLNDEIRSDEIEFINQALPEVLSASGKSLVENSLTSRPSKLFAAAQAAGRLWLRLDDPTGLYEKPNYSDIRVLEFDVRDSLGNSMRAWTYVWAIHPMFAGDLAIKKLKALPTFGASSVMKSSLEFSTLPEVIFVLDGRLRFKSK